MKLDLAVLFQSIGQGSSLRLGRHEVSPPVSPIQRKVMMVLHVISGLAPRSGGPAGAPDGRTPVKHTGAGQPIETSGLLIP